MRRDGERGKGRRRAVLAGMAIAVVGLSATVASAAGSTWQTFTLTDGGKPSEVIPIGSSGPINGEVGAIKPQVEIDARGEAVAAWTRLSRKGLSVESSTRPPGGAWSPPSHISLGDSGYVHLASNPGGETIAVWRHFVGSHAVVESSSRPAAGAWSKPVRISPRTGDAGTAAVAINANGEAVAAWNEHVGKHAVLQTATRSPAQTWSTPTNLARSGLHRSAATDYVKTGEHAHAQVVIDDAGDAVIAWEEHRSELRAVSRAPGRAWSAPRRISGRSEIAGQLQIAIDAAGEVVVLWAGRRGGADFVRSSSRLRGGGWSQPSTLARARKLTEPSRLELKVNPAGEAVAVWLRSPSPGRSRFESSSRSPGGAWSSPIPVGGNAHPITSALALDSSGEAMLIWPAGESVLSASLPPAGKWSEPTALTVSPLLPTAHVNVQDVRLALNQSGEAVALWEGLELGSSSDGDAAYVYFIQGASRPAP